MALEKTVSYTATNSYSVLNSFNENTKNVWLVFHGMGYLSKYFLKYFKELNPEENFIIAPQAPSKYYQDKKFKYIGASWLTRENTTQEIKNVLSYIDKVWQCESPKNLPRFIVLGYSQGVSIATRWLSSRKIQCHELILHSGGIPIELKANDFKFQNQHTHVTYLYGDKDPYINEAKKTEEHLKAIKLFGNKLQTIVFKGTHQVDMSFINNL